VTSRAGHTVRVQVGLRRSGHHLLDRHRRPPCRVVLLLLSHFDAVSALQADALLSRDNPHLSGRITVTASSIEKGCAHDLVSRTPTELWTKDVPSSWCASRANIQIPILPTAPMEHWSQYERLLRYAAGLRSTWDRSGRSCRLRTRSGTAPTTRPTRSARGTSAYAALIRRLASTAGLPSFVLVLVRSLTTRQGSNDGNRWVLLLRHVNDTSLNSNFATATWRIPNVTQVGFRL
jgi:hypothetical protein